jgi:hypothetical protein
MFWMKLSSELFIMQSVSDLLNTKEDFVVSKTASVV